MFRFNLRYFIIILVLLATEVCIALYVHDHVIRPYIGDMLAAILIYCFAKSFTTVSNYKAAIYALLFSYFIEVMQYFNMVALLGLSNNKVARIMLGTSFSWLDMMTYTVGIALVLALETWGSPIIVYFRKK